MVDARPRARAPLLIALALFGAAAPARADQCGAPMPMPAPEMCDGRDNDCDGVIDGLSRPCYPALVVGCDAATGRCTGICALGLEQCPRLSAPAESNAFGACLDAVIPRSEICNALDDDCNGVVDDALGGCDHICPDAGCTADPPPDAAGSETDAAAPPMLDAQALEDSGAADMDASADSPTAEPEAGPTPAPGDGAAAPDLPEADGADRGRKAAAASSCGCRLTAPAGAPGPLTLLLLGGLLARRRRSRQARAA